MSSQTKPGGHFFTAIDSCPMLMRAIIDSFHNREDSNEKASSDLVFDIDEYFESVRDEIIGRWAALTECDRELFPYRDQMIRWGWRTYRKGSTEAKSAMKVWAGIGAGGAAHPGFDF